MAKDLNVSLGLLAESFNRGIKKATRDLNKFARKTEDIGRTLTTALTLPLAGAAGAAIKSAADFERLGFQLTSVTGDAEAAANQIRRLQKIAEAPGLGFEQAVSASARLQAVGLSAEQAEEVITQFGNAVARSGGGAEQFDGTILALSQVAAKGKLFAEELNQINERIFEIRPALQSAFGTSNTEDLQELGIGAEEFIAKITQEFSKLDRVNAGLANSLENAGISLRLFAADIGKVINETFDVQGIIDRFSNSLTALADRFRNLSPNTQRFVLQLGGILIAAGPAFLALSAGAKVLRSLIAVSQLAGTNLFGLIGVFGNFPARVAAATKAFAAFNLVTKASIIGAIATGVTLAAIAFSKLRKNITEANAANKAIDDTRKEALKSVSQEIARVNALVNAAKAEKATKEDQLKAVKALTDISPQFRGAIQGETVDLQRLTTIAKDYNESLIRRAQLQAATAKILEIEEKLLENRIKLDEAQAKANRGVTRPGLSNFDNLSGAVAGQKALVNSLQNTQNSLENARDRIIAFYNEVGNGKGIVDELTRSTTAFNSATFERAPTAPSGQARPNRPEITAPVQLGDTSVTSPFNIQNDINNIGLLAERYSALNKEVDVTRFALQNTFGEAGGNLLETFKTQFETIPKVLNNVGNAVGLIGGAFDNTFDAIISGSKNAFKAFTDGIKQVLIDLGKALIKAALFAGIANLILPGSTAVAGGFRGLFNQFAGLQQFTALANGGIITNRSVLAGEEGREAIIPLDRATDIPIRIEVDDIRIDGTQLVLALKQSEGITNRLFGN